MGVTDIQFNLVIPDNDLHKTDLQIYRSISTLPPSRDDGDPIIPPLLVAFILDTSDIPSGQALIWNRQGQGQRVTLDTGLIGSKGKGKEKEGGQRERERDRDERPGIILERWTFQAW